MKSGISVWKKIPFREKRITFQMFRLFKNFSLDRFLYLYVPLFFSFCCCQLNGHSMSSYDLFKVNEDGCENNLVNNKCLHETLTRIVSHGLVIAVSSFTSIIPSVMQVQFTKIKSEVYLSVSLTFCLVDNRVVLQPPDC